jgi:hypothetical protein
VTPYDAWKLASPDDDRHEVGTEDGQPCLRYPEPDEDMPRGCRPKPCKGEMVEYDEVVSCNLCGEISND